MYRGRKVSRSIERFQDGEGMHSLTSSIDDKGVLTSLIVSVQDGCARGETTWREESELVIDLSMPW